MTDCGKWMVTSRPGNSVGRVIDTLLRNDLILVEEIGFAPLDDTGTRLLFRFIAAACERRAPGRHRYLRGIRARLLPDSRNRKRSSVTPGARNPRSPP